jgi:glycosyltransferase involved in cell wall biosynthesis
MTSDNQPDRHTIFFATRPIGPPWDEASKNLVYQIVQNMDTFSFILLTYAGENTLLDKSTVIEKKIYSRTKSRQVTWGQKLSFFINLIMSNASIYHFYFTPELYSSRILRIIKKFKKGKFLQTFATPLKKTEMIPHLAFGDAIVVQSDHSLQNMAKNGVQTAQRIYLAVDTDTVKPGIDIKATKNRLNIGPSQRVIIYAGNYYLGCNDDLIKTIVTLCKKDKTLTFILACRIANPEEDLPERARVEKALQDAQLAGQIIFLEQVENMLQLLALADIHIFPARKMFSKADIPLVLLESLALETPVIITDIPPLNEIMKDDVGELIPVGDVGRLVDAISKLLDNPLLRQEKGKRGRQMVLRDFSLKNYISQYKTLYQKLLQ